MALFDKKLKRFFGALFLALSLALAASLPSAQAAIVCEKFLVAADLTTPKRAIESIDELHIGTYNVENLFMHLGHHEPVAGSLRRMTPQVAKPVKKIAGVAKAILEMNLDIVVLQEVENIEALQALNKNHLNDLYLPVLVKGNDPRGIDVAFLIKKDLPFEIENYSFRDEMWIDPRLHTQEPRRLFSRDLPGLLIRAKGQSKDTAPLFIVIGTHNKSKRSSVEKDPESNVPRGAQIERTTEIIARYRSEFGPNVPILLAGDFNGKVRSEPEFTPLKERAGMIDAFDAAPKKATDTDSVTHVYFPSRNSQPEANQLDAIFVSPELKDSVVSVVAYRYKDPTGSPYPFPRYKKQRDRNPSDHWPLKMTLKFKALRERIPQ